MCRVWFRGAGIFTAIVGGAVLTAALIRHKLVRTRRLVALSGALLVLLGGAAYTVMCTSETLDFRLPVCLFTLGCAGVTQAGCAVDLLRPPQPEEIRRQKKRNSRRR
jgi:hypothetical protein